MPMKVEANRRALLPSQLAEKHGDGHIDAIADQAAPSAVLANARSWMTYFTDLLSGPLSHNIARAPKAEEVSTQLASGT